MKKASLISFAFMSIMAFSMSSCIVSHINTEKLRSNYEYKTHNTTLLGKVLFKYDKLKLDTYDNVEVFLDGKDVKREYKVIGYGSYTPIVIPIIRNERPRLEKYLLWKAARRARKAGGNGVIIDSKNTFTIINIKK